MVEYRLSYIQTDCSPRPRPIVEIVVQWQVVSKIWTNSPLIMLNWQACPEVVCWNSHISNYCFRRFWAALITESFSDLPLEVRLYKKSKLEIFTQFQWSKVIFICLEITGEKVGWPLPHKWRSSWWRTRWRWSLWATGQSWSEVEARWRWSWWALR